MNEELIKFETAKLAEEKGFNEHCNFCYNEKGALIQIGNYNGIEADYFPSFSAPTQAFLQTWLRTVGIKVYCVPSILSSKLDNWTWVIDFYIDRIYNGRKQVGSIFDTYEIALEKGLIEALNMIQND